MNGKTKFFQLKNEWKRAKCAEHEKIDNKIESFFASLSEQEKAEVKSAVMRNM